MKGKKKQEITVIDNNDPSTKELFLIEANDIFIKLGMDPNKRAKINSEMIVSDYENRIRIFNRECSSLVNVNNF